MGAGEFLAKGGPLTYLVSLRLSALARVCGHGDYRQKHFHSGAFLSNQWTWYDDDYVTMM